MNNLISIEDVNNKLNLEYFNDLNKNKSVDTLYFQSEDHLILVNLSYLERSKNSRNEFVRAVFGVEIDNLSLPDKIKKVFQNQEGLTFSTFCVSINQNQEEQIVKMYRFNKLLDNLVHKNLNKSVSKNSLYEQFNHSINQGDFETSIYCLERLRNYLSSKNLIFLKIKLLYFQRDWSGILNLKEFDNIVRTSRTVKTTEAILTAIFFDSDDMLDHLSVVDYIQKKYFFNIDKFLKPHYLSLSSDISLSIAKKVLLETNQENIIQNLKSIDTAKTSSSTSTPIEIKSLIENQDYSLAYEKIDKTSVLFNDIYNRIVLSLKIEDQQKKEDTFQAFLKIDKEKRNKFLQEPIFIKAFKELQQSIYSKNEKDISINSWSELITSGYDLTDPIKNLIEESYLDWNLIFDDTQKLKEFTKSLKTSNNSTVLSFSLSYFVVGIINSFNSAIPVFCLELLRKINFRFSEKNSLRDILDILKTLISSKIIDNSQLNPLLSSIWISIKSNINPLDVIELLHCYFENYEDGYIRELLNSDNELTTNWMKQLDENDQNKLALLLQIENQNHQFIEEKNSSCDCYDNKKILLYTLDQNSAKLFLQELNEKCPKANVKLRKDLKGGNPELKNSVKNSDIVFMVTAAATHSATNYIEDNLINKQDKLIKINRKGITSLRNAFKEWCNVQNG